MRPVRWWRPLKYMILLAILTTPVWGDEKPVFSVRHAIFELDGSLLLLEALIDIELPDYMAIAIDQGFAVPMSFEVEILESRKYWFDRKIVSLKQQYLLHYLPMLDAYVVSDINQGLRTYFDSREDAVLLLKKISRYPMLDIGNIDTEPDVYARLRFGLDGDELPVPLKSSSLWDNDWDLQSEWYNWEISQVRQ